MSKLAGACALLRRCLLTKQEQDHARAFCAMALRPGEACTPCQIACPINRLRVNPGKRRGFLGLGYGA
ncbi:MAG: hypothetical protein Q7V40_09460, partial [Pseudolabrys sp.]|nr:hypothetical protein [Pseudolabrys sp.]